MRVCPFLRALWNSDLLKRMSRHRGHEGVFLYKNIPPVTRRGGNDADGLHLIPVSHLAGLPLGKLKIAASLPIPWQEVPCQSPQQNHQRLPVLAVH